MTYEERQKYFYEQICHDRLLHCGYVSRNMIGDCTYLQDIMAGWEAGYQDAIDEAAEWLKDFSTEHNIMSLVDSHMLETDELVEIFKNVMEDE